jgi:tRNA U34 5-methylaminomethyl-2-thiouridine-forming methyltransferase MnmC
MNKNLEVKEEIKNEIEWREGDMPYSTQFGDYFYSKTDGRLECNHVFINGNDLQTRFTSEQSFVIAELGFGTGLNFLETARLFHTLSPDGAKLEFHSFELFPMMSNEIDKALAVWPEIEAEKQRLLNIWPSSFEMYQVFQFKPNISLHLHVGDVNEIIHQTDLRADAWYLDGFSPARNHAMWNENLMQAVSDHTNSNGTLASYTAAGWVRRNLQAAGFTIKKCQGYAGKRDMIRGVKLLT